VHPVSGTYFFGDSGLEIPAVETIAFNAVFGAEIILIKTNKKIRNTLALPSV